MLFEQMDGRLHSSLHWTHKDHFEVDNIDDILVALCLKNSDVMKTRIMKQRVCLYYPHLLAVFAMSICDYLCFIVVLRESVSNLNV